MKWCNYWATPGYAPSPVDDYLVCPMGDLPSLGKSKEIFPAFFPVLKPVAWCTRHKFGPGVCELLTCEQGVYLNE